MFVLRCLGLCPAMSRRQPADSVIVAWLAAEHRGALTFRYPSVAAFPLQEPWRVGEWRERSCFVRATQQCAAPSLARAPIANSRPPLPHPPGPGPGPGPRSFGRRAVPRKLRLPLHVQIYSSRKIAFLRPLPCVIAPWWPHAPCLRHRQRPHHLASSVSPASTQPTPSCPVLSPPTSFP